MDKELEKKFLKLAVVIIERHGMKSCRPKLTPADMKDFSQKDIRELGAYCRMKTREREAGKR